MKRFSPPFCPNSACRHHQDRPGTYKAFQSWGSYQTRTFGKVPRFRCTACGKSFSVQTFRVDYWTKSVIDYADLTERLSSCSSIRALARAFHLTGKSIQNRIGRAARQVLALASRLSSTRKPSEDLAADGFESFCVSQYFPNNIHILVGTESQFVYECDHVTLRRKGSMTEAQKARRARIDRLFQPNPKALVDSFVRIGTACLGVLSDRASSNLTLWTDKKLEYPRALGNSPCIAAIRDQGRLLHRTVSSRAARTRVNPLFPVNYLDREIRKDLHEHVRETACFGRNVNAQMERMTLYLFYHNFMKSHRSRGDRRSHAEVAGYDRYEIEQELRTLWKKRAVFSLTELTECGRATWLRSRETPLAFNKPHLPLHLIA